VSNHGGRQLDTCPATIEVLPSIRGEINRLGSKMELYVDGGIRKGSDIFKCLALGADFVFIGRGLLYSLINGQEGISKAFMMLKE
jgi:(S)-2-hydroxy-acid oxidase